jgi:hypothetical protein
VASSGWSLGYKGAAELVSWLVDQLVSRYRYAVRMDDQMEVNLDRPDTAGVGRGHLHVGFLAFSWPMGGGVGCGSPAVDVVSATQFV